MAATRTDTHPIVVAETAPDPATDAHLSNHPLIVLLGATASGKTDLAIQIARHFNGEIVNADSRQIYRFMDIGTAKPTPSQIAAAPHHLIDIAAPDQMYSLAQYQRAAYDSIDAIHARQRLPILAGGTGQYITAVVEGWGIPEVPPNHDLRAELEEYAVTHGAQQLHDRLRADDPHAADRIDYRNVRRVVRALEVFVETGTPISVLQTKKAPAYRILTIGLTMPRSLLYERVDTRIDHMVEAGLLAEVRDLLQRGYTWECPAMSGLGYIQWRDHLEHNAPSDSAVDAIRSATRSFVRRQYTWFNNHDTGARWLDTTEIAPETALNWIADWLNQEE